MFINFSRYIEVFRATEQEAKGPHGQGNFSAGGDAGGGRGGMMGGGRGGFGRPGPYDRPGMGPRGKTFPHIYNDVFTPKIYTC